MFAYFNGRSPPLHTLDNDFSQAFFVEKKGNLGSTMPLCGVDGLFVFTEVSKIPLFLCHFYNFKKSCAKFVICVGFRLIGALLFKDIW